MEWIGRKATGTRWDIHGGRTGFREYRYGYRTRGIIIKLKGRKYEIRGVKYVITPEGEFRIGEGRDYFFVDQIQFEDSAAEDSTPPDLTPPPAEAGEPAPEEEPGPSPDPNLNP